MKRLLCELWGCWCRDDYPACGRCEAALYDGDFVQIGRLAWIYRVRDALRAACYFVMRHCAVCRRRMWFKSDGQCCSQKCEDQWYPF